MNIWIDLENTPNVPFFEPIVKRLRKMNHTVYITCRDYADIPELAKLYGIQGSTVGRHGGKNKVRKVFIGFLRSMLLAKWAKGKSIDLAVGLSRTLALTCKVVGIPNATITDYEHASKHVTNRCCNWIFMPRQVSSQCLMDKGIPLGKVIRYPGVKNSGLPLPGPLSQSPGWCSQMNPLQI